ncbi:MAG TPA: 3-oxoacyl-[acyl-carrier-protein] synthase III C-terminal domain-containing protein [Syntrophales bacterium]|nr:3-oxoacyl-[acyl-carrier-protein] synthase III C-terminal domain-containing protein [Syntrophales bacterium]
MYIHGLGHYHPANVITNDFLVSLDIGTTEEWIEERVGIISRRTCLPLEYIRETRNRDPREAFALTAGADVSAGAAAASMAMERAGIGPGDVGMVIAGGSAPELQTPAQSAAMAAALGIEAPCFDLNSACTTFGMQLMFLTRMRPGELPPYILLVNAENLTRCVDFADRRVAVLFGDGAAAAVVSATVPSRLVCSHWGCRTRTDQWDKVSIPRGGFFHQDGSAVQGYAIRQMTSSLRALKGVVSTNGGRFLFVGHQANLGMLKTVCERAEIDGSCHWQNVRDYGNTGCAGAPAVLSQRWDDLRGGDRVAVALVGAGLTTVHFLVTCAGEVGG